jgi:thioredoxin-dependent peroxiredoxin
MTSFPSLNTTRNDLSQVPCSSDRPSHLRGNLVLKTGTAAPSFEAKLHTGDLFRLQDIRDQHHLVLYFYPRDFTYSCTREACSFRDHYQDIKNLRALILGVSPDSLESHQQFAREHRLAFPLISDPRHELAKLYKVSALFGLRMLRVTYVIDMKGVIRGAIHHELQIGNHWESTLQILQSLQEGRA